MPCARSYKANARGEYRGNGAAVLLMFGPATNYDFGEGIAVTWDYQERETLDSLLKKYDSISILAGFNKVNRKVTELLEELRDKAEQKIKPPETLERFTTIQ